MEPHIQAVLALPQEGRFQLAEGVEVVVQRPALVVLFGPGQQVGGFGLLSLEL